MRGEANREQGDGTQDVVRTWTDAGGLDRPPLVLLEPLEAFLDTRRLGTGELEAVAITGGHSNATFLVRRDGLDAVLRRPPRPPLPPGAHDVVREARLLRGLAETDVPVPRVFAVCEDAEVIGAPFVVMELIDGLVIADELPPGLDLPSEPARIAEAMVDTLVALHDVDVDAAGLGWAGRSDGYLERQLRRFSRSWDANKTRELPIMAELERELASKRPPSAASTLVHGDFRLGNALFAPGPPARVAALLDWEMSTIGDPLADLGYFCATWTDSQAQQRPSFHLSPITGDDAFPNLDALVERYALGSGRTISDLSWYEGLALWKAAVFMEGNYRRALEGMTDDPWVIGFREGVEELADLGLRAVRRA